MPESINMAKSSRLEFRLTILKHTLASHTIRAPLYGMASQLAEEIDARLFQQKLPSYRRSPCQLVARPFARPKVSGT
jgi:hypothetical protein